MVDRVKVIQDLAEAREKEQKKKERQKELDKQAKQEA